jgi:ubiquitin carboxyl-terminal hydrolase L3
MVPKPVKAVLMLFPITDATEAAKASEEEKLKAAGQTNSPVWFTKQTISNACGTVGVLHAYANVKDLKPQPGSFLARFLEATTSMTPEERARFLEYPAEGEPDVEEAHKEAAQCGQTAPPSEDEPV